MVALTKRKDLVFVKGKGFVSKSKLKSQDRMQNITQEVRTDGTVVTTTTDSRGRSTRDVYTPPKTTSKPTGLTQQEISAKILRPKVVDARTGKVIDEES